MRMGQISQRELESYLGGAATLLRGLVDASDYKQYIFPLMFFMRGRRGGCAPAYGHGDYRRPRRHHGW